MFARGQPLPLSGCFGARGPKTAPGRTLTFANDKNRPFSVIGQSMPTVRFAATADIEIGAACVADRAKT
jgi:hypothetical protein